MFGKRITLFKLLGFEVKIDWSWLIIAALVTWSLSAGLFPQHYPGLPAWTYWAMGVIGALGLFASIVFHEFCHSIVARKRGLPMKGITLFVFGGVAEMGEEPASAATEFMMAVVGPLSSLVLAAVCYGSFHVGRGIGWSEPIVGVIGYLAYINGLLAAFNLLPAFPLDGGRILRSILWGIKGDLRWATRVSSNIGVGFGILFVFVGLYQFFQGNVIGGVWSFLIGMFLQGAARASYQRIVLRNALEGETVRRFMTMDPVAAPPSISVKELVEDYVYKYHFKMFPVIESGRLVGCVTTRQIRDLPREEWPAKKVGELATQCSPENTIDPDTDAVKALSAMSETGKSRLLVTEGSRLVGVVALKDMLRFLALKVDLEGWRRDE
jgi:Zn-dependent protease/predicted transcriptional regulator